MADSKITDLTSRTPAVGDEIPINDISGPNVDGKVTVGACLDIINGKVNVDANGASTLSAASTDLSDTANITLLDAVQTITGAKTFGSAGAVGKLKIAGTTSGSTILDATAAASGTLTLPAATDTLVGRATTDTLTNKTLTSPVLTTPVLGTPSSGDLSNCTGIVNAGISATAEIAVSKLADGAANQVVRTNADGVTVEWGGSGIQSIIIACSDETTNLTTGTDKVKFRMPYAFTLTDVRGSLSTVATGASLLTVDVNESGVSILSTKLTFDASESTTTTAATPRVISDSSLADDAEITIDIDQVGNTTPGKGLKVTLIGYIT